MHNTLFRRNHKNHSRDRFSAARGKDGCEAGWEVGSISIWPVNFWTELKFEDHKWIKRIKAGIGPVRSKPMKGSAKFAYPLISARTKVSSLVYPMGRFLTLKTRTEISLG